MSAPPLAGQGSVARLGWMAGCWESRSGSRVTVEMWTPPAGGMMVGASRTVVTGQVRAFEYMRLHDDGRGLVFTAVPSGQREASFRSVAVSDSGFTVENPDHDFPQRISYRRLSADSIVARVEGQSGGGGERGFDAPMRRIRCEPREGDR